MNFTYITVDPFDRLKVRVIYGADREDKFARAWLFSVLAKYGWTLWASIQDSIPDIDFDILIESRVWYLVARNTPSRTTTLRYSP